MNETKRCIIFSYGPVPIPGQSKVEGGGLRCWGLAKGLIAQNDKLDITVAYHESYAKPGAVTSFESIKITTWNNGSIEQLIGQYDAVIVSYCMGDLSVTIANTIKPNQQLVLDCYVPIYVEISARGSQDIEGEYSAFGNEIARWAAVLCRGDVYLCANANQKRYYQGVLSALGRINPATYNDNLILEVPYGVYKEKPTITDTPISNRLGRSKKKYNKVLWFGAVYPWFDLRMLIDAVALVNKKTPTKLIIVGAKNPFNAHPDFVKRYDELMAYVANNKDNIILEDWVEFNDRANWYLDSDLVISINKEGEENQLAWRTRLVDYIWADLPILTNAGDPLGDELVENKAAIKIEDLSAKGLSKALIQALSHPQHLKEVKSNIASLRKKYYWENVTKPLYGAIIQNTRPSDFKDFGILEVANDNTNISIVGRTARKVRKIPAYYKKYGARNTITTAQTVLLKKIGMSNREIRAKKVIFFAHQLDTTGAPHVFIDMVSAFTTTYPGVDTEFHTFNPADRANILALNKMGIKPKLHINKDMELSYTKGDVIVLNTVAFSDIMKNSVFSSLENNVAEKLVWYIHEDEPELIFNTTETKRIKNLLEQDKITIYVAAVKTRDNYIRHFGVVKNIQIQLYRIKVDKKYHRIRKSEDFDDLRFILPGMMGDCRKGQLPLAYALIEFKRRFYDVDPNKYRNFSLTYIGVGQDFPSRQLLKHTTKGLGEHFIHYGPLSHADCLSRGLEANVTVCYSIRECLPMYVYEGMVAGHPLLRNDSSGMEEQLEEGVNGFYLDSADIEQVVETIEKVCNKRTTSNGKLAAMSKASHDMTLELEDVAYESLTSCVSSAYETS